MSLASGGCTRGRGLVVQDKDPLAAGEQQAAYRWVLCSRKTKIARTQTGLQWISRAVLNTYNKDDNTLLQVRPEVSWQPRRGRLDGP